MIQLTNQYVEIHDGELVIVTADKVTIESFDGTIRERAPYTAHLDSSDLEKGTYPFYMLKEIDEQPGVMRKIVKEYSDDKGGFNIDAALLKELAEADRIHIIACGTSYNAGGSANPCSKILLKSLQKCICPVSFHIIRH